jgi:hypothetical protein
LDNRTNKKGEFGKGRRRIFVRMREKEGDTEN